MAIGRENVMSTVMARMPSTTARTAWKPVAVVHWLAVPASAAWITAGPIRRAESSTCSAISTLKAPAPRCGLAGTEGDDTSRTVAARARIRQAGSSSNRLRDRATRAAVRSAVPVHVARRLRPDERRRPRVQALDALAADLPDLPPGGPPPAG